MKTPQSALTFHGYNFIVESNKIEGITREPTLAEREEFRRFMALTTVTIPDLEQFVSIYQPGAKLRDRPGLDVRVGNHIPLPGGPFVRSLLQSVLTNMVLNGPFKTHRVYEHLHPFTDGNGRSGRMLWAWQMKTVPLGFLHRWYYQSLDESR